VDPVGAAAAWVWVPPDAEDVETGEYRLVIHPDRPPTVAWSRTRRPVAEVVDEVAARVRAAGRDALRWWVTPGTEPADTEAQLRGLGFVPGERLEILAADAGRALAAVAATAPGVEVRPADDLEDLAAAGRIGAEVFGDAPPSAALLAESAALAERGLRTGRWEQRQYAAFVDGEPAGHAGCTFAGGAVRLWGGAVLPWARGRGAYRALIAARLRLGLAQGETLALVKARPGTSGPILRRAGFTAHGVEQAYELRPLG
jgi:Fe2+ transport system protein FeoA